MRRAELALIVVFSALVGIISGLTNTTPQAAVGAITMALTAIGVVVLGERLGWVPAR